MQTPSFTQEDIKSVSVLIDHNDQLVTIDLKDRFHHVKIHQDYQKYLGISWKGGYYVWQVLPCGVQCTPYYFYKVVRPVVTFLRENNIRRPPFVDDFLVMAKAMHMTDHKEFMLQTLDECGWQINEDKC